MIKQHYYTRERQGIYSRNPGYNTVAKSEGLSETFVKNLLQEYCFYEIPFQLVNEKDYSKFPKAYTCFNSSSGELVLGCSSFIPKDYEGKRSTYFTHNYVISEKDIFIKNPEKIVYASGFNYSFNMEIGSVLEQVKTMEVDSFEDTFSSLSDLLKQLKINEKTFKQLIMACFISVSKNKKIYIILDVDISLISKYAKGLLKYLYKALTYEVRRKIGFVTYVKDIKSKEYITIQFLPQGALKNIGTEVKAGYLFDFALNRFLTEGLNIEDHRYLDFIFQNIEDEKQLRLYMDTAEELITSNKLDINEQDELCEFFEVNKKINEQTYRNISEQTYRDISKQIYRDISKQAYRNFKAEKSNAREKLLQEKFKDYIDKLDINKMSIADIIKIKLLASYSNSNSNNNSNSDSNSSSENYEIIYLIKQAIAVKSFMEVMEVSKLVGSSFYKSKVEALIKKLYKKDINKDCYFTLMCAFSKMDDFSKIYDFSKVRSEDIIVDLNGVIKFINENGSLESSREFVVWLCSEDMNTYTDMIMNIEVIKKAVKEYINLYDNKIFKDKATRNLLMKESNKELREFLKKEEYKRIKGIRKIFSKWR